MTGNELSEFQSRMLEEISRDVKELRKEITGSVTAIHAALAIHKETTATTAARHDERIRSLEDSRKTQYTLIIGMFMALFGTVAKVVIDALG